MLQTGSLLGCIICLVLHLVSLKDHNDQLRKEKGEDCLDSNLACSMGVWLVLIVLAVNFISGTIQYFRK